MIPKLTTDGVIPPFLPEADPTLPDAVAPYRSSLEELVHLFGFSDHRRRLLKGYLDYRNKLQQLGFRRGFQWIAGSFVEDCEKIRNRPPNDIDLVSLIHWPDGMTSEERRELVRANQQLFNPNETRRLYYCDAYVVPLDSSAEHIVKSATYWSGLFSHQRASYLWKGFLQVELSQDDTGARVLIRGGDDNA